MSGTISPRLVIVFILNLLVLFLLIAPLPPVRANGTTVRYYLQPDDGMAVPKMWYWYPRATEVDLMVLNMDTPSPQGPLVECSWCDFVTRPLIDPHRFRSFKVHIYVRWPQSGCCNGDMATDRRICMAIGYATSDLAKIQYTYEDVGRPIGPELAILDLKLSGWVEGVGEVSVGVSPGMRVIFHFGSDEAMLGEDQPCLVRTSEIPWTCILQPTILFGDSQHASYIETDAVELQGQPIPELPMPAIVMIVSTILALVAVKSKIPNCR